MFRLGAIPMTYTWAFRVTMATTDTHARLMMGAATIVLSMWPTANVCGPLLPCYNYYYLNTSDHRHMCVCVCVSMYRSHHNCLALFPSASLIRLDVCACFVLNSILSLVVGRLIFVAIVNIWTIVDAELSNCSAPPYAITRFILAADTGSLPLLSLLHL